MMSYVYAITDRPDEPLPGQLGLNEEELAQVVYRDIGAVVSRHDGSHVAATAEKLWRHEQVVETLMSVRTVLPMRFGTALASSQAVEEMLSGLYSVSIEDIARVRDHVEIGIRFLMASGSDSSRPPSRVGSAVGAAHSSPGAALHKAFSSGFASSPAAPGAAYLRMRLASEQERRDRRSNELGIIRKAYQAIAGHATTSNLNDGETDDAAASASFLVRRDGIKSFQQQVARLADAHPKLAILCTGPWPAYSFVSAHASDSTVRPLA